MSGEVWRGERKTFRRQMNPPVHRGETERKVSAMDQCEDTEEGVPPSKTPLCGHHESQTKGQRSEQNTRRHHAGPGPGPGPGPSCVSIKSDESYGRLIDFKGAASSPKLVLQQRPASPGPSCVSMKSDRSMDDLIYFKDGHQSAAKGVNQQSSEVLRGPSVPQHQRHLDSIFMVTTVLHSTLFNEGT
ncbi:uncharacterized protein KZ484_024408 [Pholidichthys leucotaenia]